MTHAQLRTLLAIVTETSPTMLFMFLNHQMRQGNGRLLGELPPISPGCTIRLVKWSFFDARRYFDAITLCLKLRIALPTGISIPIALCKPTRCYKSTTPTLPRSTRRHTYVQAHAMHQQRTHVHAVPTAHAMPQRRTPPLHANLMSTPPPTPHKFYAFRWGWIPGI
jgi:hypothetical protein